MSATALKTKHRNGRQLPSRAALRLQDDKRLVALVRSGSEPAFETIVERYRGPLLRYSRRLLGSDQAQDVVQQAFMNAHAALLNDDRSVHLKPWLYRIAHNASVNALKKNGSGHEELDENYDGVPRPPEVTEQRYRLRALFRQISDLPERQRAALLLREFEGRSYEEIAGEMGATVPIVRELLYRARVRLRNGLGALIPLSWLKSYTSVGFGSQRIARIVEGAPAGAGLAKLVVAVVVVGTVTGGVALNASPHAASRHVAAAAAPLAEASVTAALHESERAHVSRQSRPSAAPEVGPQAPSILRRSSSDKPAASSVAGTPEGEVAVDESENDTTEEDTGHHAGGGANHDSSGDEADEADDEAGDSPAAGDSSGASADIAGG